MNRLVHTQIVSDVNSRFRTVANYTTTQRQQIQQAINRIVENTIEKYLDVTPDLPRAADLEERIAKLTTSMADLEVSLVQS